MEMFPGPNYIVPTAPVGDSSNMAASTEFVTTGIREKLTAARTYYVRTDGSDSNTGLANTAAGAFLTIQKAINVIAALDISIYNVTSQVGAGTYTGNVTIIGPWVGSGTVTLQGDTTTPTNVILSTTSANCIDVGSGGRLSVGGFQLKTTTSGSGIAVASGGAVTIIGNMDYGAMALYHLSSTSNGTITNNSFDYTISGSAVYHIACTATGFVRIANRTLTISGTPAFTAFALCIRTAVIELPNNVYSGSATGIRYDVELNGSMFTNAGTLPGNVAGVALTGGQYV